MISVLLELIDVNNADYLKSNPNWRLENQNDNINPNN